MKKVPHHHIAQKAVVFREKGSGLSTMSNAAKASLIA
jgi:hypothetical protein